MFAVWMWIALPTKALTKRIIDDNVFISFKVGSIEVQVLSWKSIPSICTVQQDPGYKGGGGVVVQLKAAVCFNQRGTLKARGTAVRLQTCEGTVMALWYATFGKVSFYDYYHHLIIALSQLTSLIAPLESFSSITPQNRLLHLNDHMYYGCFQVCLSVWSCFILTVNLVKQLSESLLLSQSSVSNNENDSRIKTDLLSICGRPPYGGLW